MNDSRLVFVKLRRITGVLRNNNSPSLLAFGRLLAAVMSLISAPVIARAIGPEGRGETAAAIAVFMLAPVLIGFGIPLELRRLGSTVGIGAAGRSGRIYCLFSFVLSPILAYLSWLLIFNEFESASAFPALLGVVLLPLTLSWACDISLMVVRQDFRGIFLLNILHPATYLALVVLMWISNTATIAGVLWAHIIANIVTFVAGLLRNKITVTGDRVKLNALIRGGAKFSGSSVADAASNRLDQAIALPLLGALDAGLYSVAMTVATAPLALAHAIGAKVFPSVARAKEPEVNVISGSAVRQITALSLASTIAVVVVGPILVKILFGPQFTGAIPVLVLLTIFAGLANVAYVGSMLLAAQGRGIVMTLAQVTSLVVGIGMLLILGPIYGVMGAAIASGMASVTLYIFIATQLRVRPSAFVPRIDEFRTGMKTLMR